MGLGEKLTQAENKIKETIKNEEIKQTIEQHAAQGNNEIINKMEVKTETTKPERKVSTTYTIQRFKATIETLEKTKLVNTEELQQLKELQKKIVTRWIGETMSL